MAAVSVMSFGAKACSVVIWGTVAQTPRPQITNITPPRPEHAAERRLLHVQQLPADQEDSSESGLTVMCLNQDSCQRDF